MGLIKKLKNFLAKDLEKKSADSEANINDETSVEAYCEQLVDITYSLDDLERQYRLVSDYFQDIQRIEDVPIEIANEIMDVARKIQMIEKARKTFEESERLLTATEYNNMSSINKKEAYNIMKKMSDYEMRDNVLRSDMGHLEGEKAELVYLTKIHSKRLEKQKKNVGILLVLFLIGTLIGITIAVLQKKDITLLVLGGLTAIVSVFVVFFINYRELRYDINLNNAKLKKAISLLNKVKAKYINNTNTLEYMYEKYGVNSLKDLEYQWQQYIIMLEDRKKYSQANSDLRIYSRDLTLLLRDVGIKDAEIWSSQTSALLDRREMVEIKHNLNSRRQKIRDRREETIRLKEATINTIKDEVRANPELMDVVSSIMASYHIKI